MNETIEKFISENGIDVEKIRAMSESKLQSIREINSIVERYQISGPTHTGMISIANILGHNQMYRDRADEDVFELLNHLFDASGDGYHRRSVGMLDYSMPELISGLQSSFSKEPMVISMIEDEKYVITYNGMHRFAVLRAAYLHELSKTNSLEQREDLNKKYSIPATITDIDYVKTYCNYMLSVCLGNQTFHLFNEYDKNHCLTDRSRVEIEGETYSLTDEELINYTRMCLNSKLKKTTIDIASSIYPSFDNFINTHFQDLKESAPSRS